MQCQFKPFWWNIHFQPLKGIFNQITIDKYDNYWYHLTNKCDLGQPTCFLRPTLWENWTTLKEWIFSLQETDFLKKSSMNIFGTYPNFHISVTQEGFSNKITFTIQHGLKSLLWHSAPCHVFAYTCLYIHIHAPIFLTIPHFDWGSWGYTFGPTKMHHFARKI